MMRFILAWLWTLLLANAAESLIMVLETSVANKHFLTGRLTGYPYIGSVGACVSECCMDTDCVTAAYSTNTTSCLLYSLDVANFVFNTYLQHDTEFYKVVCDRHDYTYVRALNMCIKLFSNEETFQVSRETCDNDTARLMVVDTVNKMDYLRGIMAHIQGGLFSYYLGGYGLQDTAEYYWFGSDADSLIEDDNGGFFWGIGEPSHCSNSDGCCISLQPSGKSIKLISTDCLQTTMFICVIDV